MAEKSRHESDDVSRSRPSLRPDGRQRQRARHAARAEEECGLLVRIGSEPLGQELRADPVLRRPRDDEHRDCTNREGEPRGGVAVLLQTDRRRSLRDEHLPRARRLSERRRRARHASLGSVARRIYTALSGAVLVDPSALQRPPRRCRIYTPRLRPPREIRRSSQRVRANQVVAGSVARAFLDAALLADVDSPRGAARGSAITACRGSSRSAAVSAACCAGSSGASCASRGAISRSVFPSSTPPNARTC